MTFTTIVSIGTGGFFGAICRYLVSYRVSLWLGSTFPYGTLLVNALGSFLLGFLTRFLLEHMIVEEAVRLGVLVGFLGAFTTFSTFSYESVALLQDGEFFRGAANIVANALVCIILCLSGLQLAKLV